MDRATNERLRELDRRLQLVYRGAYEKAVRNHKGAIEKLAAFDAALESGAYHWLSGDELVQARRNYALQVQRTTGITESIARDLAGSGKTAAQLIQNEALSIYEAGYRHSLVSLDRQLGVAMEWSVYDRNQLRALMLDEDRSPFSQVAYNRLGVNERRAERVIIPRLQNELAQSVILGEGIPQINRRIRNTVNMSYRDAQRIARTETLRVANQGRMLGYEQARDEYGIEMVKEWIATLDPRTRDQHADIHGETAELDEPFSNGLMHPLDPNGPPEEVINCRCVVVSVLKDLKGSDAYRELQERVGEKEVDDAVDGGIMEHIEYTPLASTKEAQEYAANTLNLHNASYGKMHVDIAYMVNKEIHAINEVFGDVVQSGYLEGVQVITGSKTTAVASYNKNTNEVSLLHKNVAYSTSLERMSEQAQRNFEIGFWSTGSPEHVIRHEIGHGVGHWLTDNDAIKRNQLDVLLYQTRTDLGITTWSRDDTQENKRAAGERLSYYGLNNVQEFMAESIAEYVAGNPRQLATQVVNVLLGK